MIYLDFVWVNKLGIGINIVDILVSQSHPVAPVQRANIVIYRRLHGLPVVFDCTDGPAISHVTFLLSDIPGSEFSSLTRFIEFPAKLAGILDCCAQQSRLVHELLWNAANVDARSAQA